MSWYHAEQYWTGNRQHAKYGWRDLGDDDLDTMDKMRRDREVRSRDERSRARRSRWSETREPGPGRGQHWGSVTT